MAQNVMNVDTKHPLYSDFITEYERVDDCVAGERRIKKQGSLYLPRPSAWDDDRFKNYQLRARFMNATARTLSALIGIAMEKPLGIQMESSFDYLRENSDGKGRSINQLFRDALSQNLRKGRGGILLDNTKINDGEYMVETTIAQNSAERWVLRHFDAKHIINWRTVNGKLSLLVLKYHEEVETDGFEHDPITIWLEYRMVKGKCYGRVWKSPSGVNQPAAIVFGSGESQTQLIPIAINGAQLDHIPFAWYGSENNDEIPDAPPLADIAALNIGHYQADADIAESAFITGQPTVSVTGLTEAWAKNFIKNGVNLGAAIVFGSGESQTQLIPIAINGAQLDHIPFAWYGSENNDEIPDAPPLADIAALNIGHYQADADIAESAFITGQPTVSVTGLTEAWAKNFIKNGVNLGAMEGLLLPVGGKLEIVQAKETTVSFTRQDRIQEQLALVGAKFIERGAGSRTATQATDEAQTDNSVLSQCVGNVEAAINLALSWVGAGTLTANKRYVAVSFDSQALVAMMGAVQSNLMLIEDFVKWQQQIGLADPNATVEDIVTQLRNQNVDFTQPVTLDMETNEDEVDPDKDPEEEVE
ncbi:MAG: hypothetical protein [Bacteriophage sp.]|nr:MAG: hypothetical protein [Bacteriophage sp.]